MKMLYRSLRCRRVFFIDGIYEIALILAKIGVFNTVECNKRCLIEEIGRSGFPRSFAGIIRMSSFVQKATPFFEHIFLGFAFAAMGYVLFWTFGTTDASWVGVLGMIAVCFGGLKILMGIIIYLGWIFTLIFRPEYARKKEQEAEEERLRKKEDKSYLARHWGTALEISLLLIGFLIIIITRV